MKYTEQEIEGMEILLSSREQMIQWLQRDLDRRATVNRQLLDENETMKKLLEEYHQIIKNIAEAREMECKTCRLRNS